MPPPPCTMSIISPLMYSSIFLLLLPPCFLASSCSSWCPYQFHHLQHSNRQFQQKTDRFWEFSEQAGGRWVEVQPPSYDDDDNKNRQEQEPTSSLHVSDPILPLRQRKRLSLARLSDTSLWVTGESGSIYERFWNGLEWVIAPHDLPLAAGPAIKVFVINHTILALSEAGKLYLMQVQPSESSEAVWVEVELTPTLCQIRDGDIEQNFMVLKSGIVSHDGQRAYFCTKNGMLVELAGIDPPRWVSHGQPAGANVAAIADAASTRGVVYTISSSGDLYEHDRKSKPSWKRHIWQEGTSQVAAPLIPSRGCTLNGLTGAQSESLFLLTKVGTLVERRLHQRKWKWVVHGSPKHQNLTSITPALQDESSETSISLFFSTSTGSVFEYRFPKQLGNGQNSQFLEALWVNHVHPLQAKAARGIPGLQLQVGRIVFPLDDGRLGELHLVGLGGESSGPAPAQNSRRKLAATAKYVWSILDVPESEGWNAEYCTEERGPRNCITGMKDESKDSGITSVTGRRKQSQAQDYNYLSLGTLGSGLVIKSKEEEEEEEYNFSDDEWIRMNFRLRLMHEGKSFFLTTEGGMIFEYLCIENVWIWLRHESSTEMKGILGNYNGSLFMVDAYGSLLLRERVNGNELSWKNCSAMKRGRSVIGGQPWDGIPGKGRKVTTEDALFFISKNGRLLQFMVSMRKFKWKDCKSPLNTKVGCIVDQGLLRENIVFVTGTNGRLYQYNRVTDLWHEHHHQSQHLILSQFAGTTIRPSNSLSGSLFLLSREGGLVEYHWNTWYGWNWVEHGTPYKGVTLVGSPGPCFEGNNQLFLIGSDGKVYLRYMDKEKTWKWKDCGFPFMESTKTVRVQSQRVYGDDEDEEEEKFGDGSNFTCDPKVASTRSIPFSNYSVIFELRDGRLAEIQLIEETKWEWSRIIGTPTSLCIENYWAAIAS